MQPKISLRDQPGRVAGTISKPMTYTIAEAREEEIPRDLLEEIPHDPCRGNGCRACDYKGVVLAEIEMEDEE